MDDDEIGGWCPKCDGQFALGITECPDCAIPLIGADEERPPEPAEEAPPDPVAAGDEQWVGRLHVVAAACSVAVLGLVAGAALQAYDDSSLQAFGNQDVARWRLHLSAFAQVARPGVAVVVLAAGLSLAAAAHLARRPARRPVALLAFGSSLLLDVVAAAGLANQALSQDSLGGGVPGRAAMISGHASALVVAGVACWLTDAWRPTPAEHA